LHFCISDAFISPALLPTQVLGLFAPNYVAPERCGGASWSGAVTAGGKLAAMFDEFVAAPLWAAAERAPPGAAAAWAAPGAVSGGAAAAGRWVAARARVARARAALGGPAGAAAAAALAAALVTGAAVAVLRHRAAARARP
jgi:hypothetical protein